MPRRHLTLVWLSLVAFGLWLGWLKQPCHFDDTFIVVRYARNLLHGHGWVFNPGELVNGSTSTLNTLLMTLLGWVTGERWILAQILQFGFSLGSFAFVVFLLFLPRGRVSAFAAVVFAFATPYLYWTVGLETAVMLFLAAATVWAYQRERLRLTGLLAGLLCLTRGDGVLLVVLIFGHFLWRFRRQPREGARSLLLPTLIFLAVLLPWVLYSYWTFGTALPATLQAKLAQVESGLLDGVVKWSFWAGGIDFLGAFLAIRLPGWWAGTWFVPIVTFVLIGTLGCLLAVVRRHPAALLVLFGGVQFGAYGVWNLPNSLWYYVPANLSAVLGAAVLLETLWNAFPRIAGLRYPSRVVGLSAALVFLLPVFPDPTHRPREGGSPHYGAVLYAQYRESTAWIREHCPPQSSIACLEVGVVGFELPDYKIVDMLGLVTEGGTEAIAKRDFTWWIRSEKPDYALLGRPPWMGAEALIVASPDFLAAFEPLQSAKRWNLFRRKK